jgi:hypothetical protein
MLDSRELEDLRLNDLVYNLTISNPGLKQHHQMHLLAGTVRLNVGY